MARHLTEDGEKQSGNEDRKFAAKRFGKQESPEPRSGGTDTTQRIVIEMMKDEQAAEDIPLQFPELLEKISPDPPDVIRQCIGRRDQVETGHDGPGTCTENPPAEQTLTRSQLQDAGMILLLACKTPQHPTAVTEEVIDQLQVASTAPCPRIGRIEMVQQFRDEDTFHLPQIPIFNTAMKKIMTQESGRILMPNG
jgi:hypothetical protein